MTYVPESLRREVGTRAKNRCEYCLLHERYTLKKHEVDHIRAEKHGGATVSENLCLSCFECNRNKGSDLSSIDPVNDEIVPLFHPRHDTWAEHFKLLETGEIEGISPKGCVTATLFAFNHPERVLLRQILGELYLSS